MVPATSPCRVVDTASGTFVERSAQGPFAEQLASHDAGRCGHRYRQARGERSHCPDGFVVRHEMSELQVERLPSRQQGCHRTNLAPRNQVLHPCG